MAAAVDMAQLEFKNWIQLEELTASFFPNGDETYSPDKTKKLYGDHYKQKGLTKQLDLGAYWEEKLKVPIPLGGIVIKKNIDQNIAIIIDELIRKSIEYAFDHYPFISDYVKQHSQEMNEEVMRKHINLYVNEFSLNLGDDGKAAVNKIISISKLITT